MCVINTKANNSKYLADGQVRKALSYAFDYDTAIETAWNGYAMQIDRSNTKRNAVLRNTKQWSTLL